jgi:hypothetical protein
MATVEVMNWEFDAWFDEEDVPSLSAEDLDWWQANLALSRDDLYRICEQRKAIMAELRSTDEILDLTFDVDGDGGWYIAFRRHEVGGKWHIHVYRDDQGRTLR